MIFKILFSMVGFGMMIGYGFAGIKMFSIGVLLRQRNADLIGKEWNGRVSATQLKKLRMVTMDEISKRGIDDFLKYSKMAKIILIAGIGMLLLIGFWNSALNT